MLKNKPGARLGIYAVGLLVVGALVLLNFFNVINDDLFGHAIGVINTIGGLLGVGAIGTAFTNLGRQAANGTFDVSGTPAEQLAQAARNWAAQKAADDQALANALHGIPGGQAITDAVLGSVGAAVNTATEVVTACGDALR